MQAANYLWRLSLCHVVDPFSYNSPAYSRQEPIYVLSVNIWAFPLIRVVFSVCLVLLATMLMLMARVP